MSSGIEKISRRQFIAGTGALIAGGILLACDKGPSNQQELNTDWPVEQINLDRATLIEPKDLEPNDTGIRNLFIYNDKNEQWVWFFPAFKDSVERQFTLVADSSLGEETPSKYQTYPNENYDTLKVSELNALDNIAKQFPGYAYHEKLAQFSAPLIRPEDNAQYVLVISADKDHKLPLKFVFQTPDIRA